MLFKLDTVKTDMVLEATNRDLEDRWILATPELLSEQLNEDFSWSNKLDNKKYQAFRIDEITRPYPGYDDVVGRPVIVKVLKYKPEEVLDKSLVLKKRKALEDQIRLLNDLSSPLVAEPLDYFTVLNQVDGFQDEELKQSEPVLVLDYLPGDTLSVAYRKKRFNRFELNEDPSSNNNSKYIDNGLNISKICMFISRIIGFLKLLDEKGYMFLGLTPQHILVLKNEVPRFVGIGKICKVKDGKFDQDDLEYKTTIRGYSAPELNIPETNFGKDANALATGVYCVGVIFAQIMAGDFKPDHDILKNGAIAYPNERYQKAVLNAVPEKGASIDRLLTQMCHPNPKRRLTNLEEIDLRLKEIGGILLEEEKEELKKIKEEKKAKRKAYQNTNNSDSLNIPITKQTSFCTVKVKSFDKVNCCGIVEDLKTGEQIKISSEALQKSNLKFLVPNSNVKLMYEHMSNGYKLLQNVYLIPKEGSTQLSDTSTNTKKTVDTTMSTKKQPVGTSTSHQPTQIDPKLKKKIELGQINVQAVLVEEESNLKKINAKYPGKWHFEKNQIVLKDSKWTITDGMLVSKKLLNERKSINSRIERGEVNITSVLIAEKSDFDTINAKYPGNWVKGRSKAVELLDPNWTIKDGILTKVEFTLNGLLKTGKVFLYNLIRSKA